MNLADPKLLNCNMNDNFPWPDIYKIISLSWEHISTFQLSLHISSLYIVKPCLYKYQSGSTMFPFLNSYNKNVYRINVQCKNVYKTHVRGTSYAIYHNSHPYLHFTMLSVKYKITSYNMGHLSQKKKKQACTCHCQKTNKKQKCKPTALHCKSMHECLHPNERMWTHMGVCVF